MKRLLPAILLGCFSLAAQAQVIINKYAAVLSHPPCGNVFNVDDASGFGVGDTILVIQMKGATIDSSNTASFGSIINYNGAGNYEFNVISAISGNAISLRYNLSRLYNIPAGRVQFVRVPYFQNYTLSQTHSCMPWNGTKGGIIVINAAGTVTLNAGIDVSRRGFRNGGLIYATSAPCGQTSYFYQNAANSVGAEKGEGIAELSQAKSGGRGALANGGGGGNSHNGGGGGGSNGGAGGNGGKESAQCSPAQSIGGVGGASLTYSNAANKVFMGGGTGAPHANNNHSGSGGPGGGIVLILANQLDGNAQSIVADGADGIGCPGDCWDAQFGGSAGGSILLHTSNFNGNLTASARGGKGASQGANNTSVGANGTGGGGGGGVLWVKGASMPSQVSAALTGGTKGVFTNTGDSWGSSDGAAGLSLNGLNITFPTDSFKGTALNVVFKDSVIDCFTRGFIVLKPAPATGMTYSWDFGNGTTSNLPSPSVTFFGYGTHTVRLTITDGAGCSGSSTQTVIISPNPGRRTDTTLCAGESVRLAASGGSSYSWFPTTGLSSTSASSTIASPAVSTMYIVTISAGANCTYRDTFMVNVSPSPIADFFYAPVVPIPNTAVKFTNASSYATSYSWTFGDGASSSETNPSHLYKKSGTYRVCLVANNGSENCTDSVCKTLEADVHTAIGVPSAFSPNNDGANDILFVRGGGVESFNLKIFNRWGQQIFETNAFEKGWDGTFKNKPQEMETYAYLLIATFIDGTTISRKGNINLLR